MSLGPDGAAYVGVLGGLVRLADAARPAGPPRSARKGCAPRPRLRLLVRRARRGCRVVARIGGEDRGLVRRAVFRAGIGRRRARRAAAVQAGPARAPARRLTVRAFARLRDGRAVRLAAARAPLLALAGRLDELDPVAVGSCTKQIREPSSDTV